MNICVINIRENNPHIGGVENVSYHLCEEWIKSGHKVICVYVHFSNISVAYNPICPEYYLPMPDRIFSSENVVFIQELVNENSIQVILNLAYPWIDVCALCYQVKLLTGIKFLTAIHYAPHQSYIGAKLNLFLRRYGQRRSLFWLFQQFCLALSFFLYRGWRLKREEVAIVKVVANQSDVVVVLSEWYMHEYIRLARNNNFVFIHNPLSSPFIAPIRKKNQVLYVGRLEYGLKRFDRVIDIWRLVGPLFPDWELLVLGGGAFQNDFQEQSCKYGLDNIRFMGYQPPISYMQESKILILTSSSEGFPMVLLESMQNACVPIVFNSFGAAKEMIKDGYDGFLIRPFKMKDFADKLQILMRDEVRWTEMSKNAKMSIGNQYDARVIASQWISLFKTII